MNIITSNEVTDIWESMPGGPAAWLKEFGYAQFAAAVEEKVVAKLALLAQEKGEITRWDYVDAEGDSGLQPAAEGYWTPFDEVEVFLATTAASAVPAGTLADDDRYQYVRDLLLEVMRTTNGINTVRISDVLDILSEIAAAPSAALSEKAEPQWISVDDEREPAEGQKCILLIWPYGNHENEQIEVIAEYFNGTFVNHDGDDMHQHSHWMPFPNVSRPASTKDQAASKGEQAAEKGGDANG